MAVSCTSAAACSAVGFAQARSSCFFATSVPCGAIGLVERWDGKQWSLGVSARPPGSRGVALDGVSCAARAICTAVGFFGRRSRTSGLIEMWDGTHWWIPRSSTARATTELTGVSCPSPTFCAAVGYLAPNYRTSVGIAEHWDGSEWLVDRVAHVDRFSAVSCVSRIACTAIGERPVSLGGTMCNENVVERWNGQAWSVQHATDFGDCYQGSATSLTALSCATISDCTAVGGTSAEGFAGSFVAYWSARGFSSSTLSVRQESLDAVSCPGPAECVAAGDSTVLREDGTTWSPEPTQQPMSDGFALLRGVSCASTRACLAVGSYTGSTGPSTPLIEATFGSASQEGAPSVGRR